ncbi:MAG: hypothetical protein KDI79_05550 [Anaerolineae bacterium]|nr:hypothetical protein [Anaerolineae bacterium]
MKSKLLPEKLWQEFFYVFNHLASSREIVLNTAYRAKAGALPPPLFLSAISDKM